MRHLTGNCEADLAAKVIKKDAHFFRIEKIPPAFIMSAKPYLMLKIM